MVINALSLASCNDENIGTFLDENRILSDNENTVWGRTGFDRIDASGIACRGRSVGLVNNRIKKP